MSILGIALPLLGVGGIGAALFFVPGLKEAVVGFVKSIPPKAWLAIGAVALLAGGYFYHQRVAHKALSAEYQRGRTDEGKAWQDNLDKEHKEAERWRLKFEADEAKISNEERARNEQNLRDITSRADDQRMRGPGKAAAPACVGQVHNPSVPAAASGSKPASGNPNTGLAGLPPEGGLAIVPWADLVALAERADGWRAEVLTWREDYARQAEANRKEREAPAK